MSPSLNLYYHILYLKRSGLPVWRIAQELHISESSIYRIQRLYPVEKLTV